MLHDLTPSNPKRNDSSNRSIPVCLQVIFASHTVCIRCQVCQPALDLCPDCHACDLQLGAHSPSHPYVVVDSAEFPVLRSEWTAR